MAKKKLFMSKIKKNLHKSENNFYRMTLTVTLIFVIARTTDMVVGILIRSQVILMVKLSTEFMNAINLARQITFLFMYASYALSPFIYVTKDLNLKRLCIKMLKKKSKMNIFN